MQTEFEFTLPRGYLGGSGQVHRYGVMRLATAMDEILAAGDPRVQANEAYLPVLLLSRVVTRLGDLPAITPQLVEEMFASDLVYLEDLYLRLNSPERWVAGAICPHCSNHFLLQIAPLGEMVAE
jgi:hypothetical protein